MDGTACENFNGISTRRKRNLKLEAENVNMKTRTRTYRDNLQSIHEKLPERLIRQPLKSNQELFRVIKEAISALARLPTLGREEDTTRQAALTSTTEV